MRMIWDGHEDDYFRKPAITDSELEKAEKKFGIKLPQEYKDLLKIQNGGTLKYTAIPTSFTTLHSEENMVIIEFLYGLHEDEGIYDSAYLLEEWGITDWCTETDKLFMISGDGHWWLVLDYRESEEPKIAFIDVDDERIERVAGSFKELVEKLQEEPDTF
ncbi:SMI1/KNR4 family protein [Peribacillus sp. SCS-37]|uniref:SMI1/KNR4 family protein n=1 Tax=Paraperibacillus esterisolvens TaxID=3115296 RepID=UPI003905F810